MDSQSQEPSLAETLQSFTDDALAALLEQRGDLAVPQPTHFEALATRACSVMSVSRALDLLDERTLRILDGLRLVAQQHESSLASVEMLATVMPAASDATRALGRLRSLALLWGKDDALRLPASLAEACGPYIAGLGRPVAELNSAAAALADDKAALRRAILAASPQARAVLDRLAAGPPIGNVSNAYADEPADTPVRWLLAHHLLVAVADDTVELPREVGVLLRRDHGPLGELRDEPAVPETTRPNPLAVDSAGAAQVCESVRLVTVVLDEMVHEPVTTVKSGGLSAQSLQRLARAAELSHVQVAVLIEAAYSAGLIGIHGDSWLPSHAFDTWRSAPIASRWSKLAKAWLDSTRDARLTGPQSSKTRPAAVLSQGLTSRLAPLQRKQALELLASQAPGCSVDIALAVDICAWRHPRTKANDAIRGALEQAALLGITARDSITRYGRILIEPSNDDDPLGINKPDVDPLLSALDDVLPPLVEDLVVQSDLTVIVPGFSSPLLSAELTAVTDKESATTHRVTEASLRRAMDAGYSAEDIRSVFTRRSRTEIPQTLSYLIDDVARRHGGLRAGTAGAYLRSEDETLVAQVLADRRLGNAQLRRLAPTLLVSPLPLSDLVDMLRQLGHAPVAEDTSGAIVIDKSVADRAASPTKPEIQLDPAPRVFGAPIYAIVDKMREAPLASAVDSQTAAAAQALETLREVVPDRKLIWVEYIDRHGETVRRLLRPVSIGSGYLRAEDKRTDMLHTIALHTISAVSVAAV